MLSTSHSIFSSPWSRCRFEASLLRVITSLPSLSRAWICEFWPPTRLLPIPWKSALPIIGNTLFIRKCPEEHWAEAKSGFCLTTPTKTSMNTFSALLHAKKRDLISLHVVISFHISKAAIVTWQEDVVGYRRSPLSINCVITMKLSGIEPRCDSNMGTSSLIVHDHILAFLATYTSHYLPGQVSSKVADRCINISVGRWLFINTGEDFHKIRDHFTCRSPFSLQLPISTRHRLLWWSNQIGKPSWFAWWSPHSRRIAMYLSSSWSLPCVVGVQMHVLDCRLSLAPLRALPFFKSWTFWRWFRLTFNGCGCWNEKLRVWIGIFSKGIYVNWGGVE